MRLLTRGRVTTAWSTLLLLACSGDPSSPGSSGAGGAATGAGTGGSGHGGVASGGSAGALQGGAPSNASGGVPASGGSDTSRGGNVQVTSGGQGNSAQGGASNRGGAEGLGGRSPSRGGAESSGGRAGAPQMAGGASGANLGGSAGASGASDRCDVAKLMSGETPAALSLTGNLGTHDPSAIFAHGQYYEFQTGRGLPTKTSTDLLEWKAGAAVFASNPSWIAQQVPGATDLWAPDISYFGGEYHLYYAASTFGSNKSCIGHASRAALNSGSWTDHGSVICSNMGTKDDWNAIDPNVIVDEKGTPWMAFGSFWGGLKLIQLDNSGKRANTDVLAIAARPSNGGAIEAPYIVRRCGYYYLFASFDNCCKGVDSTYKIMVGRATSVTGPYKDKQGVDMMKGGGTLILQGGTRWRGPGHNAVLFSEAKAYNVYHSYDANNDGASFLRISELFWDEDGWPVSGGP